MPKQRRQFSAAFKFQVALEAVRNAKTAGQIASEYGVHPTQVGEWKKQLLEAGPAVFAQKTSGPAQEMAKTQSELYEQIGRLKMELEWLKKKAASVGGGATRHD
jgi:transposase-like protein